MKCPHCNEEIQGISCGSCGAESAPGANYCMACGESLKEEHSEMGEGDNGIAFEDRVLCPDGTCTGIIVNGKCSECGKRPDEVENSDENESA